nr:MAG TPA: hypothetical protein [Caudoviricetes sp.]
MKISTLFADFVFAFAKKIIAKMNLAFRIRYPSHCLIYNGSTVNGGQVNKHSAY